MGERQNIRKSKNSLVEILPFDALQTDFFSMLGYFASLTSGEPELRFTKRTSAPYPFFSEKPVYPVPFLKPRAVQYYLKLPSIRRLRNQINTIESQR